MGLRVFSFGQHVSCSFLSSSLSPIVSPFNASRNLSAVRILLFLLREGVLLDRLKPLATKNGVTRQGKRGERARSTQRSSSFYPERASAPCLLNKKRCSLKFLPLPCRRGAEERPGHVAAKLLLRGRRLLLGGCGGRRELLLRGAPAAEERRHWSFVFSTPREDSRRRRRKRKVFRSFRFSLRSVFRREFQSFFFPPNFSPSPRGSAAPRVQHHACATAPSPLLLIPKERDKEREKKTTD